MSNIKLSKSEENYLKSIFNLSEFGNKQVTTNSISKILNIEPASVTSSFTFCSTTLGLREGATEATI